MQHAQKKIKSCFSLVEIALSNFLLLALIYILLTTSARYLQIYRLNLQQLAMSIASKHYEP